MTEPTWPIIGTFQPREFELGGRDALPLQGLRARAEAKAWLRADVRALTRKQYQRYWDAHTVMVDHHTIVTLELTQESESVVRRAEVEHTDYGWRPSRAALLDIGEALGFTRDVDISDAWHEDFGGNFAFLSEWSAASPGENATMLDSPTEPPRRRR